MPRGTSPPLVQPPTPASNRDALLQQLVVLHPGEVALSVLRGGHDLNVSARSSRPHSKEASDADLSSFVAALASQDQQVLKLANAGLTGEGSGGPNDSLIDAPRKPALGPPLECRVLRRSATRRRPPKLDRHVRRKLSRTLSGRAHCIPCTSPNADSETTAQIPSATASGKPPNNHSISGAAGARIPSHRAPDHPRALRASASSVSVVGRDSRVSPSARKMAASSLLSQATYVRRQASIRGWMRIGSSAEGNTAPG